MEAIMTALHPCYGSLDSPDFRKIHDRMDSDRYRRLIEAMRSSGMEVTETTDRSNDVSIQIVVDQGGDQVGLGLSGVDPFAVLLHQDADGEYSWVTRPDAAPTLLATLVATAVNRAGFQILDRGTVARTIKISRADGETETTLYQALFSDTDKLP